MPFTHRIEGDPAMVTLVGEGELTQPERLEAMRALLKDPAFRPGLPTLCDLSAASSTPTLQELQQIVDFIDQHAGLIGRTKIAMVTAKPSTFGVARQFQALAEEGPAQVQVFASRDAALAWLRQEHP